ncbi:MAG: virulence RhuM family protein, partial [Alphaproteobacteria bacterium]
MTQKSEILIYKTEDGETRIQTLMQDENVWLSQAQMADLFQKTVPTINEHIKNVYDERELLQESTIRNFLIVQTEGKREVSREVNLYNLDMIIAVGYRVKSHRGTQFRQWATQRLKEYLVKGFALDDVRLERGSKDDYFDELAERVRAIRVSERRFYQKITDIYATSVDYNAAHPTTQEFFATVQNKFHYAIHGMTAAEVISKRVDADKPYMGLSNFKGKSVKRGDVAIAKNYLTEGELGSLNRVVDQYLSFAEEQAVQRRPMMMQDWIEKLHGFLTLNDRKILSHKGKVSADDAEQKALREFEKYRQIQDANMVSDFDKVIQKLPKP